MKTIVVVDKKWGIGRSNDLLFSIPEDMKRFREITTGKVVVMGLNTLRSFPGGRPLKNRKANIVLSDVDIPAQEGLTVCRSMEALMAEIARYEADEVFIIGGGMMYNQFCDLCSEAYITKVDADGGAAVFFPNLDKKENWSCAESEEPFMSGELKITFCKYVNNAV